MFIYVIPSLLESGKGGGAILGVEEGDLVMKNLVILLIFDPGVMN